MSDALTRARQIVDDRIAHHGDSPFYQYAAREMPRIEARLSQGPAPDRPFYETLTHGIGLMCARELEASDPEFCDAIYAMLEQVRAKTL